MTKLLLVILFASASTSEAGRITPDVPTWNDAQGNPVMKIKADGSIWVSNINVSTDIVAEVTPYTIEISTTGRPQFDTQFSIEFSSDVVIQGELRVHSTRARAIWVPKGGIHLDGDGPGEGATPPGQVTSKKIKTSTITLSGTAIIFLDDTGNPVSTMTKAGITIESGNIMLGSGEISGRIKNSSSTAHAPADSECDEDAERGAMVARTDVPRLYYCAIDGWRYTNLTPAQ